MKKLLLVAALVLYALYEWARYPGEKHLMNTWKGR